MSNSLPAPLRSLCRHKLAAAEEAKRCGQWQLERDIYDSILQIDPSNENAHAARAKIELRPNWCSYWMSDFGEDEYGRWAAISISGVDHRFRWCPPGMFLMGSPESERERQCDEGPQHDVELTQGFWLGDAAVTQQLWETIADSNPSQFKGPDLPVTQVSWFDCEAWMSSANGRIGALGLRFPTEAEWEYAARAGTTGTTYLGGNDAATLDVIAWYKQNSSDMIHPIKQKVPNSWGLYDMLGNVWECCADNARPYAKACAVNPHGGAGLNRAFRGGSARSDAGFARVARRLMNSPEKPFTDVGLRLARDP